MTRYEQKAYRTPNNTRKEVLQNILILTKEQVLKAVREKSQVADKGEPIRAKSDILRETRSQKGLEKCILSSKSPQVPILYSVKLPNKSEKEIKIFHEEHRLKKFMAMI